MTRLTLLLTLSALAIGCSDEPQPKDTADESQSGPDTPPTRWFVDQAANRGLDFTLETSLAPTPQLPEIVAGGLAVMDIEDDGWMDIYLVQATGPGGNRLFRNTAAGRFEDVTDHSQTGDDGFGMGAATGDVDGNGTTDLLITNLGPNVLLMSDGHGRFTNATETTNAGHDELAASASFADIDGDHDLDLFITNYVDWAPEREIHCLTTTGTPDYCPPANYNAPTSDVLLRNDGGTFTDISQEAGVAALPGTGLGVVARDFNGDGQVDFFVANDGMPDRLWVNAGDNRFEDQAMTAGCDRDLSGTAKAGMGVVADDFDDDGDTDLLVCNLIGETDSVFHNDQGRFTDVTARLGLASHSRTRTRFGVVMADFDNDGHLDLYEANGRVGQRADTFSDDPYAEPDTLMIGTADGRFTMAPDAIEPMARTSRGLAVVDVDNDGGLDLVVVDQGAPARLLINTTPSRGHWMMLDVRNTLGAPAIGAVVEFDMGDRTVTRTVHTDGSYCAASDPRVHLGLGTRTAAPTIRITWPGGKATTLPALPVDQIHRIDEPAP